MTMTKHINHRPRLVTVVANCQNCRWSSEEDVPADTRRRARSHADQKDHTVDVDATYFSSYTPRPKKRR